MTNIPYGYVGWPKPKRLPPPPIVIFYRIAAAVVALGLILLILVSGDESPKNPSQRLAHFKTMKSLLVALQAYQIHNPNHPHFSPGRYRDEPGIVLTPIQEPLPNNLLFLTTPVSYLNEIPIDPFISGSVEGASEYTPIVLRWTKTQKTWRADGRGYDHHAWGVLSFGPSKQLPPQYELSALRQLPYYEEDLRKSFYDPSNGTNSQGIFYIDTMGNRSRVESNESM